MKSDKSIAEEAKKEGESTGEEKAEYQHIDEYVKSLDPEELTYLKGCLKNHKHSSDSGKGSNDGEDKTFSEKDYE